MKLKFSFRLKIRYKNCGLECSRLILNYYGIRKLPKNLLKEYNSKTQPLWLSDLGILAIESGFKAVVFTYSQTIFQPEWFFLPPSQFLEKLHNKTKIPQINHARQSILKFINKGGSLRLKVISIPDLEFYIKQKIPILLAVSSSVIHNQSMLGGHFIIVIGYDKKNFIILNPGQTTIKKEIINKNLLLYAFYHWGAWALILKNKKH